MHSFVNHMSASNAYTSKGARLLDFYEMPKFRARLGERIAQLRERAGLSQRDAANSFDPPIASSTVARIESGISWPEYAKLERFAELYGCAVDDFFTAAEASRMPAHQARALLIGEIVALLPSINDRKLRSLLGHASAFAAASTSVDGSEDLTEKLR